MTPREDPRDSAVRTRPVGTGRGAQRQQGRRTGRASAPAHAPRVPFTLLVTGLIVGGMALLLALNTASAANELRRHDFAGRDAVIGAQVQELRNEVAARSAPAALAAAAVQFGMVPAGNPAFLVVAADGVVTVKGSPGPATEAPVAVPKIVKPKPKASTTRTASHPSRSSSTASKKAAKSGRSTPATSKSAGHPATATAHRTSAPRPTPTPTPTVTMPGGTR